MPDKPVPRRPKVLSCSSYKLVTGCGNAYIMITQNEKGEPQEMFVKLGKAGGCAAAMLEAIGRAVSIGLRAGVSPRQYVKTFRGISCPSPIIDEGETIASCVDACAKAIEMHLKEAKQDGDGKSV